MGQAKRGHQFKLQMYDAVLNSGSTVVSLQPKPIEQQDRSFYAYGNHRPPPRYQTRSATNRRLQPPRVNSNSQTMNRQAAESYCMTSSIKKQKQGVDYNTMKRQQSQTNATKTLLSRDKYANVARQRRGKEASPLLSDNRTRSHFGVSTQMMIEDGTASHVMMDGTPHLYIDQYAAVGPPIKEIYGQRPLPVTQNYLFNNQSSIQNPATGQGQKLKTFFRQNTMEIPRGEPASATDTDHSRNPSKFGYQNNKRSSLASENIQNKTIQQKQGETHVNSTSQLDIPYQNRIFDKDDQVANNLSELRNMEANLENLTLAAQFKSSIQPSVQEENSGRVISTMPMTSMQNHPATPTLNVIVPSGLNTAFQEPLINNTQKQKLEKKRRPKTAQYRGAATQKQVQQTTQRRRILTGQKRLHHADSVANSSMIVMNEKRMSVAAGTTTKGIVSLYNKGFVPKKTGMVSRASKFAAVNRQLYSTATGERQRYPPTTNGMETTDGSIDGHDSFSRVPSSTDTGRFPFALVSGKVSSKQVEAIMNPGDFADKRLLKLPPKRPLSKHNRKKDDLKIVKESKLQAMSSSQSHYSRKYQSSNEHQKAPPSDSDQTKLQPSELNLTTGAANSNSGLGAYQTSDEFIPDKATFKLPTTQEMIDKSGINVQKQSQRTSNEVSKSVKVTNEDQDSREMTDNDEVMQPINLLEKIASNDAQKKSGSVQASNDTLNELLHKNANKGMHKDRKSVHSKRSFSRVKEQLADEQKPMRFSQSSRESQLIPHTLSWTRSDAGGLGKDLQIVKSTEFRDSDSVQNYRSSKPESHTQVIHSNTFIPQKSMKSPDDMQSFVGSLQSRPLIGSQLVKNLARLNSGLSSKRSISNTQTSRQGVSKSHLGVQAQIKMKVSTTIQQTSKGPVSDETATIAAIDPILLQNLVEKDVVTPKANSNASFMVNLKSEVVKQEDDQKEGHLSSLEQALLAPKVAPQSVETTNQTRFKGIITTPDGRQQLTEHPSDFIAVEHNPLPNSTERQGTQKTLVSGISSHTKIGASGKVKHMFMINQANQAENAKGVARTRSKEVNRSRDNQSRKKRKKTRPQTSRINRRARGLRFDLKNDKASDGEDIATIMGGSTSRNNQMSHREMLNRRNSGYADENFHQQVASLPNFRKVVAQELITDTNGSNLHEPTINNLASSKENFHKMVTINQLDNSDEQNKSNKSFRKQLENLLEQNKRQESDLIDFGEHKSRQANNLNTLPNETTLRWSQTKDSQPNQFDSLPTKTHVKPDSLHNSINDYLKNEDIRGVQIMDLQKSALMDSNQFTVAGVTQSNLPTSQVTVYKEKISSGQAVNMSQPTTINNIPVNAMYSHMSQQRGTGYSVETPNNMITDPRLGTPTNIFGFQDLTRQDQKFKVVTKITSKMSSKDPEYLSHQSKTFIDESKITMDFNQQVDVKLLSPKDGGLDSPNDDVMSREMQLGLAPTFVSAYKVGSGYCSSPQSIHMMQPVQQTSPQARPVSQERSSTSALQQQVQMSPSRILIQDPNQQVMLINSGLQQPLPRMDLSGTIKKSQEFLKYIQMTKNAPVRQKIHQKQDDLLILKERQVVPLSVATMPEKPSYQKHLYSNGGNPGLEITGKQTHTITKTQFKNYVAKQQRSLSPRVSKDLPDEPKVEEFQAGFKHHSQSTLPLNTSQAQRYDISQKRQSNPYDMRFPMRELNKSETQTQNEIGVGVDEETVRSHLNVREDLNITQLITPGLQQSRDKSFVSSLIRDDLQYTPSQSNL